MAQQTESSSLEESSRMLARKRAKRRKFFGAIFVTMMLCVIAALVVLAVEDWVKDQNIAVETVKAEPTVMITDESRNNTVSGRIKEYVGQTEIDFADLNYKVTRAVLPEKMTREVDIYLEGYEGYIKMNVDRDTAVSVEDADRMIRYLEDEDEDWDYIDVRVEGKGYWK